ncbi:MAG: dipeptidase [Myxococcales bacterium]|nr:dipeptidase [Myxococcales bacterium]
MLGSSEAHALHREHPPIDLHADTLTWARWLGYDLHARHEPPLPLSAFAGHVDVPRMREAGMGAQCFGLVSLPIARGLRGLARTVTEQIELLVGSTAQHPGDLRLVRTADEIEACGRAGVIGALLGIEGAHALEGDIDRVEVFARLGVRYLGFLHFSANDAGRPAYGPGRRDDEGLTPFGRDLVRRCEAAGVLVDLSHINRRGFLEACAIATRPPIVSHTGVLGAHRHWRNIDDAQLRAVADRGGVVGVIFYPRYLGGQGLDPVVRHLRHILDVVGEDAPALGSDWDGMIIPTRELRDPRGLPLLTDALLRAGVPERVVAKILRGNVLRVLREA